MPASPQRVAPASPYRPAGAIRSTTVADADPAGPGDQP